MNPYYMAGQFWRKKQLAETGVVDIFKIPILYLPTKKDIEYLPYKSPITTALPSADLPNLLPKIGKWLLFGGVAIGGIYIAGKLLGRR